MNLDTVKRHRPTLRRPEGAPRASKPFRGRGNFQASGETRKCYNCGKPRHLSRQCKGPRNGEKKIIAATSHNSLSWTACYDDMCKAHMSDKDGSGWYPRRKGRGSYDTTGVPTKGFAILDKTGEIEETDTHGTQEVTFPEIETEPWTLEPDDELLAELSSMTSETIEEDTPEVHWWKEELKAIELRKRARDVLDGKKPMPRKDTRTTGSQIDYCQLEEYIRDERRSRERERTEKQRGFKDCVEQIEGLAQDANAVTQEPRRKRPYEIALCVPPGGIKTIHDGYITPDGGYIPPGFYTQLRQLQLELWEYDPSQHPERRLEKEGTTYYHLWQEELEPVWPLTPKNDQLPLRD